MSNIERTEDMVSQLDLSVELDEYDVYDELEEQGLCDVMTSPALDVRSPSRAVDPFDHESMDAMLTDDDDDDADDELMDYFDLEEEAELAGKSLHLPSSPLSDAFSVGSTASNRSCCSASLLCKEDDEEYRVDSLSSSPPIAYRRNIALGCLSPPRSPYLPIHLNSFLQSHPEARQWMKENDFSYPERYPVAPYSPASTSSGDGYAGDAWQTWGAPDSPVDLYHPGFDFSCMSSTTDDASWKQPHCAAAAMAASEDDDDVYSPSDDWLFGAYGVNGRHQWIIEELQQQHDLMNALPNTAKSTRS